MPTLLGMRTHKILGPVDMKTGLGQILGKVMCDYLHLLKGPMWR